MRNIEIDTKSGNLDIYIRKLKVSWSLEAAQDLSSIHGIKLEDAIVSQINPNDMFSGDKIFLLEYKIKKIKDNL